MVASCKAKEFMYNIKLLFTEKRNLTIIFLALLIPVVFLLSLTLSLISRNVDNFNDPATGIVVIDAGHGGIDGGTGYEGFLEKEINLSIAKRVCSLLTAKGFTVIMTRDEDISMDSLWDGGGSRHQKDLNARARIINESRAQLFVSIHVNSNYKNPNADGSIVFYSNKYSQTKDLAYCIQRSMNSMLADGCKRTIHDPQTAGYFLLDNTKLPGVIVETAFISNKRERELLITDKFRDSMAQSLVNGIEKYYETTNIYRPRIASNEGPLGKLAIIIDDFGQDRSGVKEMMSIQRHLTFAVMPFLAFSQKDAIEAHEKGFEVIIHLPLEANTGKLYWLGPRPIFTDSSGEEISKIVNDAFENVPHAVGANIHMGSKASGNEKVISYILDIIKEKDAYFVDSRTAEHPVAVKIAAAKGIPCFDRNVFLDGKKPKSYIVKQLETAMDLAIKHGKAIAVGHVGTEGGRVTAQAIEEMLPQFDKNNVRLVYASELED